MELIRAIRTPRARPGGRGKEVNNLAVRATEEASLGLTEGVKPSDQRRRTMNNRLKRIVLLLALLSLGAAFARSNLSFGVYDRDFTYFNSKTGYVSLGLEGDKLMIHITDQPTPMKLNYTKIRASNHVAIDGTLKNYKEEQLVRDPAQRLKLQHLADVEVSFNRAKIAHENARMSSVVAAYTEALSALGFESSPPVIHGRVRNQTFVRDHQRVKLSFYRGTNGRVGLVNVDMRAI